MESRYPYIVSIISRLAIAGSFFGLKNKTNLILPIFFLCLFSLLAVVTIVYKQFNKDTWWDIRYRLAFYALLCGQMIFAIVDLKNDHSFYQCIYITTGVVIIVDLLKSIIIYTLKTNT